MTRDPKAPVLMTRSVMLKMANSAGNLFGGTLMGWMDEVSGIAAHRFTWTRVTTAAVKAMNFYVPIPYGTVLQLEGRVVRVGHTSGCGSDSLAGAGTGRTGTHSGSGCPVCVCLSG